MVHAVAAVFSGALTVVLMLLVVAISVLALLAALGLLLGFVGLLLGGSEAWLAAAGEVLSWIFQVPVFLCKICVRINLRLATRAPGPRRWHLWVANHPGAAQSARSRLVRRRRVTPEMLRDVFVSKTTTERVRIDVVLRCDGFGGVRRVMPSVVGDSSEPSYVWPLTYADDAVVVQDALRRCFTDKNLHRLRSGYARLASLAGPEAVWALELDRVGSLDLMDPVVRASMLSGEVDELLKSLERYY